MRLRVIVGLAIVLAALSLADGQDKSFSPYVDSKGQMRVPEDFRVALSHLGTYVISDEKSENFGFHDVYTQASTVKHYRKTQEFPDGAILVKELRKMTTEKMTTGRSSYATDLIGWFVMVKDAKGRFKDNEHWGEGWGWGLFMKDAPQENVSKGFMASCMGCHTPARLDDWVFIDGYPTLASK